ncbi:transcriptional regulator [Streptomyces sp. ISL-98]|uniref:transcriptional regulator n=1 Tax=Streptomyces sp. ISL-98 TaxID=2819192 RepID=UPI00255519A7|nr:transcriptional regulator [Streptomyces sp. ISL-98]
MSTSREAEVELFAEQVRALKERSGRSYGALARRLGVSASTLHRYGSGEAVPAHFAPVERLARLCGAPPQELLELHRLWILADATRRPQTIRKTASTTAASTPPSETSVPMVSARTGSVPTASAPTVSVPGLVPTTSAHTASAHKASAHKGPTRVTATLGPASAPATPDSTRAPATQQPAAPQPAAPDHAAHPAPVAQPPGPAEPAPSPGPPTHVTAAPIPSPRRPRRLRKVVLAAAAVVAVASGLAALAFAGPGSGAADDRRSVASIDGASDDRTGPPPTGSPTGHPSKSGGAKASTSAPPRRNPARSTPPTTTGPRAPAPKTGGATGTAVPFTWTADSDVWQSGCNHNYLINRSPDQVPPPPVEQDAKQWARSLGALHGGDTNVRISLQGTSEKTVVLEALRVRVTERAVPVKRNVYGMNNGCGGALSPRYIDVNLDAPRPVARSVAGFDGVAGTRIPAVSFPYTVTASDPEVLLVTSRTVNCDCYWYLELEWSSGARSGTVRISDNGRPFRTSGTKGMPRYEYAATDRRWITSQDHG